jgi:2-polyprenyl-3-methyl-5-hydroxy-6-metoxy-1,4-benzoquinol methylase
MDNLSKINSCLACGCEDLVLTLDLQDQPLANSFQTHAGVKDTDEWFPLAINRCGECNHLQLTHAVNPEIIYTHYLYVSGTSGTYREYMHWYAQFVAEQFKHTSLTVLDIGCNDGSQLSEFKRLGFKTYGVDPAKNLHTTSTHKGHNVICDFWPTDKGFDTQFDVITAQNSFAHNPDPLSWLLAARQRLDNDGKIFIQTSQADMVLNGEFDTIYHEHINYFNAESMKRLAERAGLHLIDVIKVPIHGTSYIFILAKQPANEERMRNILAMEILVGLQTPSTYTNWATGVNDLLVRLKDQIDVYRNYYTVVGYGAAAKGMTLINASDIHLDCVIDDNPLKQGLYCPGTAIPVVSIDWLDTVKDPKETIVFIPLAWNFYREIKQKIVARRNNPEDIFLRYFPTITTE